MTRLTYTQGKFLDRARRDSARAAVFADLGIEAADLVAFAERWGDDPDRMYRLSEQVRVRVDSLNEIDAARLREPAPPPGTDDPP